MVSPRFGVEFVPQKHPDKIVEYTVLAEKVGIDYVWITDHYNNRNVYITLTLIALNTKKVYLGPGVTNPYVINPCWTASALATLDEVSNGRAVLGIGAGDKATLQQIGITWAKPLTTVKEAVIIMRKLLDGETVKYDGKVFKVLNARLNYKPTRKIPIYIGAQAPKMLQLAGELGDGVLINASHPDDFKEAVPLIKKGAEKAGKDPGKIDIVAYTCFSVDLDKAKAKEAAIPVVAFIVAGASDKVIERHGIKKEDVNRIREYLSKGKILDAFKAVTDDMLEAFSIYGTPKECIDKINTLLKVGITQIVFGSPIGPSKKKSLELVGEILEHFKQSQ